MKFKIFLMVAIFCFSAGAQQDNSESLAGRKLFDFFFVSNPAN